jgi:hypothetical protein
MYTRTLATALALCFCLPAARASAQVSRIGDTFLAWSASSKGSAIAYDSRNDVYLAVSSHGAVYGRFLHPDGAPLGQPFLMQAVVYWGHFPHVAYSPDANGGNGAFLVTWLESDGPTAQSSTSLHTRLVSYNSGFLTPDRMIFGHDTYWEIMGAPVAYSTVSREFLVVWRQYLDTNIFAMRLSNTSDPLAGPIPVAAGPLLDSDPSVTYNPATDEFFTVYRQGYGTVNALGQRIKAGTGALVGGPILLGQAPDIRTTGVTYNAATGQYIAAWHQFPANAIYGRVVGADGTPIGNVIAMATSFGSYDSLSIDVSDVSGTAFLVGHDKATTEDAGVEIGGNGLPTGSPIQVTATCFVAGGYCPGNGNYYPKVTSHSSRREWMVVTANRFSTTLAQRIGTGTVQGLGPPPPPPPPPPSPSVSNPLMWLDTPANGASIATQVAITGWAVDLSAPSGTGVDTVHVWALPAGGSWTFLGAASMGVARPDVAGAIQRPEMTNSGFGLLATLPPGTYDIAAHAHSVVSNTFNNVKVARVTVVAPPSRPRMYIDLPAPNQTVPQFFVIAGWAIDLEAATGPGVSVIHAWGYPVAGGSPVFAGGTTVGGYRSDVAVSTGDPRFAYSGYELHGSLPRGEYNLVVFAMSTITGTFNNLAVIRIRVV